MAKKLSTTGYLTYADLAEHLSCHVSTVKRMWQKGSLPAPLDVPDLGIRFREDEVMEYLAVQRSKAKRVEPKKRPKA